MFKISISLEAVFTGRDFIKSMEAIKSIGINAFEFWSWWDKDLVRIQAAKESLGLDLAAFATRFISLADPAQRSAYIAGLRESIAVARRMNCPTLISQVGNELPGVPRAVQHQSIVEGLKQAALYCEEAGITLVVEPLNTVVDHPGYYLYSSDEAFRIIDEVGSPYVRVLYDIYHQQIMEGNLIARIQKNIDKIGHFHAAGNPGRHELYIGEINYIDVFRAIAETGYSKYVGFEYFPLGDPLQGLWRTVHGIQAALQR
ncbi:TIM barrel protein [Paenibacillus sp. N4]|uniref:hydroxypyruvate isomerase family protein n=1 Tax=Paenibacillus vietnamensis TaxID=2590547 RepID=UPI001CD116A4|nr:TIM barrel protein [Paenibacillus vietnamensis]MCA0757373.1 TIM barrel protein [Paenibacillus vietnamensis]